MIFIRNSLLFSFLKQMHLFSVVDPELQAKLIVAHQSCAFAAAVCSFSKFLRLPIH